MGNSLEKASQQGELSEVERYNAERLIAFKQFLDQKLSGLRGKLKGDKNDHFLRKITEMEQTLNKSNEKILADYRTEMENIAQKIKDARTELSKKMFGEEKQFIKDQLERNLTLNKQILTDFVESINKLDS